MVGREDPLPSANNPTTNPAREPRLSNESIHNSSDDVRTPLVARAATQTSSSSWRDAFLSPKPSNIAEKKNSSADSQHYVICPSQRSPFISRTSAGSITVLTLSVFSTLISVVYAIIASAAPLYGHFVHPGGKLSPSTAATITALFAKMVELSFVTVVVTSIGQYLTRRAFLQQGKGISMADLAMRNWVLQPGMIFTQFKTLSYPMLSGFGLFCIATTIVATLYTTASSALVAPQLRFSDASTNNFVANVSTSFANAGFQNQQCVLPTMFSSNTDPLSTDSCTTMQYAARAFSDYERFNNAWVEFVRSGNKSVDLSVRPHPIAMIEGSDIAMGQWVEVQDTAQLVQKWDRMVNNVSVAMPHSGVYGAAKSKQNGILQPEELDGQGGFILDAAVPSPVLNVLCANMDADELKPIIFQLPNIKVSDVNYMKVWPKNLDFGPLNNFKIKTVVDDLFEWGDKYNQHPPVFPRFPDNFNTILNTTFDYGRNAAYFLGKAPPSTEWPFVKARPFVLCRLQTYFVNYCSTHMVATGGQTTLSAHCEDPSDKWTYAKVTQGAPIGAPVQLDWPTVGTHMLTSIALNTGITDANASIARLLMSQTLQDPAERKVTLKEPDSKKTNNTTNPDSVSKESSEPDEDSKNDQKPDTDSKSREDSDSRTNSKNSKRSLGGDPGSQSSERADLSAFIGGLYNGNGPDLSQHMSKLITRADEQTTFGLNSFQPSIAESLAAMVACTLVVGNFGAPMRHVFDITNAPPGNVLPTPVPQEFVGNIVSRQYASGGNADYQRGFFAVLWTMVLLNLMVLIYLLRIFYSRRHTARTRSVMTGKLSKFRDRLRKTPSSRIPGDGTGFEPNQTPSKNTTSGGSPFARPSAGLDGKMFYPSESNGITGGKSYSNRPPSSSGRRSDSNATQYVAISPKDVYGEGALDDNSEAHKLVAVPVIPKGLVQDMCESSTLFSLAINSPPSDLLAGSCGGGPSLVQTQVSWKIGRSSNGHWFLIGKEAEPEVKRALEKGFFAQVALKFSNRASAGDVESSAWSSQKENRREESLELKIANEADSPGKQSFYSALNLRPLQMPHLPGAALTSDHVFGHSRSQSLANSLSGLEQTNGLANGLFGFGAQPKFGSVKNEQMDRSYTDAKLERSAAPVLTNPPSVSSNYVPTSSNMQYHTLSNRAGRMFENFQWQQASLLPREGLTPPNGSPAPESLVGPPRQTPQLPGSQSAHPVFPTTGSYKDGNWVSGLAPSADNSSAYRPLTNSSVTVNRYQSVPTVTISSAPHSAGQTQAQGPLAPSGSYSSFPKAGLATNSVMPPASSNAPGAINSTLPSHLVSLPDFSRLSMNLGPDSKVTSQAGNLAVPNPRGYEAEIEHNDQRPFSFQNHPSERDRSRPPVSQTQTQTQAQVNAFLNPLSPTTAAAMNRVPSVRRESNEKERGIDKIKDLSAYAVSDSAKPASPGGVRMSITDPRVLAYMFSMADPAPTGGGGGGSGPDAADLQNQTSYEESHQPELSEFLQSTSAPPSPPRRPADPLIYYPFETASQGHTPAVAPSARGMLSGNGDTQSSGIVRNFSVSGARYNPFLNPGNSSGMVEGGIAEVQGSLGAEPRSRLEHRTRD